MRGAAVLRLAAALALASLAPAAAAAGEATRIEVFTRPGCPHCAAAHRYLASLGVSYEVVVVDDGSSDETFTLLAAAIPARRAASIDPQRALRHD